MEDYEVHPDALREQKKRGKKDYDYWDSQGDVVNEMSQMIDSYLAVQVENGSLTAFEAAERKAKIYQQIGVKRNRRGQ